MQLAWRLVPNKSRPCCPEAGGGTCLSLYHMECTISDYNALSAAVTTVDATPSVNLSLSPGQHHHHRPTTCTASAPPRFYCFAIPFPPCRVVASASPSHLLHRHIRLLLKPCDPDPHHPLDKGPSSSAASHLSPYPCRPPRQHVTLICFSPLVLSLVPRVRPYSYVPGFLLVA